MQLKCDGASFILQANTRSGGRYGVVLTIGLLVDAQGQIMPANQAWAWITERLGKQPLDCGLKKSRGSFAVHGTAYALTEAQRQGMAVRARVGGVEKSLHVFPPRYWHHGVLGWSAVQDGAIHSVPLVLANAYGGSQWPDNPQGMGHVSEAAAAHGVRLAPLELAQPGAAVLTPEQRAATASFLPLPPQHTQRRQFLGALDAAWVAQQAPYLPAGTDLRWLDEVAQDQCHSTYWRGNEPWEVVGMHPSQPQVSGHLPGLRPRLFVQYADPAVAASEAPLDLDTVWLFPADEQVVLLYRTHLAVQDMDGADIDTVALGIERADEPRLAQQAWLERLLPSAAQPALEPPAPAALAGLAAAAPGAAGAAAPPDAAELAASLQAASDPLYDEVAQAYADGLAQSKRLADRMGLPFDPEAHPFPPNTNYAALLAAPALPSQPLDAAAMRAEIEAEIAQAMDAAQQQARDILERMGLEPEAMLQQAQQDMRAAQPVDLPATLARLDLPEPQQTQMLEQLSAAAAQERAVEAEIDSKIGALSASIAANNTKYLDKSIDIQALPAIDKPITREILEARYAAGEGLQDLQLQGLDLSGIDLRQADLQGSVFENCQLQGACLAHSHLARCQFIDCDLGHAQLAKANLSQALLQRVVLRQAVLTEADLTGMRAQDCDLTEIDAVSANGQETQWQQCQLNHAALEGSQFGRARFNACDLRAARWAKADLQRAQLQACQLGAADLRGANLREADFSNVAGQGLNLSGANLSHWRASAHCTLEAALLAHADLSQACLQHCDLSGADLRGATLNAALLQHCNLSATHGAQLVAQNAYFSDCNLSNAQWPEANLLGSRLRKVCLEQVDLRSSNLHGLRSEGANSKEIYLNHALMTRCNLREDLASG